MYLWKIEDCRTKGVDGTNWRVSHFSSHIDKRIPNFNAEICMKLINKLIKFLSIILRAGMLVL